MHHVDSPYVMKFLGYMLDPLAIVMPWMECSLYDALSQEISESVGTRLYWAYCASMGVLALHRAKIVHRDIKSLNFLLDQGCFCGHPYSLFLIPLVPVSSS